MNDLNKDGLPRFVTFPEAPTTYFIKVNDEEENPVYIDGRVGTFAVPSEAYDFINNTLLGEAAFEVTELTRFGSGTGGMFFQTLDNRLLISHTQKDSADLLKAEYQQFLKTNESYLADPTNWALAYRWLQTHPAFWHRSSLESSFWSTDQGLWDKWESVLINDDGEVEVLVEHGPWLDERTQSSLDHRLDAWGSSFEECYVKFAAKVHKYYGVDGFERPEFAEGVWDSAEQAPAEIEED